jgi:hypothetical protein
LSVAGRLDSVFKLERTWAREESINICNAN